MSVLERWTWLAIAVLVVVPPIVFVLFLRDATRLLRAMGSRHANEADPLLPAPGPRG